MNLVRGGGIFSTAVQHFYQEDTDSRQVKGILSQVSGAHVIGEEINKNSVTLSAVLMQWLNGCNDSHWK